MGRMDEVDLGQVTRPKENVTGELSYCTHTFLSTVWIHKITKKKESDRCDLCKTLWIVEDRFKTEKNLPEQTVGHIQHTCEALSVDHIDAHHHCW